MEFIGTHQLDFVLWWACT